MQAPTVPSEPSAPRPAERACPACGASNGRASAFCWQCYRPFGAPAVGTTGPLPGAGRPGVPRAWVPSASPTPIAVRGGGLGTMAGVIVLTLAVVAGVVVFLDRRDAVAVPDAFAGMHRIEDGQTRLVTDTFHAQADATGIEGDIVFYGVGAPTAALIWVKDARAPTTDAAFDQFAGGFNAGIGSDSSLGAKSTTTIEGVTYVCAAVSGASQGALCMWQADDVFWLMFDFSGAASAAGTDLAVVAHDAVEAA